MNKTKKHRLIYNDDGQGVRETNLGSVEKDLREWIDKPLSQLPIDFYAWCIAFPHIVIHNSKVGEVYGSRFETPPNHQAAAMEELHSQETDVMRVVVDQTHKHGVECFASIRMGDTHSRVPDADKPPIPQLLLDHPEYAIKRQDGVYEPALDYSHAPVRQRVLAIVRELAEGYDIDGIELDFVRWGKLFARNEAPFKTGIMTEFVGQVRQILDEAASVRSVKYLKLGVQVPRSLYLSHLCGLSPQCWIKNEWLDYIIQCDFNSSDPQTPVTEFAEICSGTKCSHHVRMGAMMGGIWTDKPFMPERKFERTNIEGYGRMVLSMEEARGTAANIYGLGADGVGLWNICCNMGNRHKAGPVCEGMTREEYQQHMLDWAAEVADPEKVFGGTRNYHFVPIYKGYKPLRSYPVNSNLHGPLGEPVQIVRFPGDGEGYRQSFSFLMADGKNGEQLAGTLRVRILQSTLEDKFKFDINGATIDSSGIKTVFEPDDELPAVWYEIDLAKCPPFKGSNELGMTPITMSQHPISPSGLKLYGWAPYMEELEIIVETIA